MRNYKKIIQINVAILFIFFTGICLADNHNFNEIIDLIQKDLKTLEKAVYSETISTSKDLKKSNNDNSEKVLTRHLLKLSEIETQFQELTNKFEEINFKLDKISSRLSKIQADNQLRFQDIENVLTSVDSDKKISFKPISLIIFSAIPNCPLPPSINIKSGLWASSLIILL